MADWQECTSRIAAVSYHVLMGRTSAPALAGDPRAMGIAAYISGMGPLLGYWLNEGIVSADEPVSAVLRTHLQENQRRTTKLVAQAVAIVTALHRNGIDVTVLKGMHTAFAYLPEPAVRPMSDIDLLIEAYNGEIETVMSRFRTKKPAESDPPGATTEFKVNLLAPARGDRREAQQRDRLIVGRDPVPVQRRLLDRIVIVAVAHGRRRPGYWKSRL